MEAMASWATATKGQLLPKTVEALAGQRVLAVSAGGGHNLALTADGSVWSWGNGRLGKLGHGDEQLQLLPKKIEAFANRRVVAVSAGGGHNIALLPTAASGAGAVDTLASRATATSRTGCCRRRSRPLLASASSLSRREARTASPSPPTEPSGAGAMESTASWATADSRPSCCPRRSRPLLASAWSPCREQHSLARTADGAVFTWGKGESGCLGHGEDLSNHLLPKKIEVWAPGQ